MNPHPRGLAAALLLASSLSGQAILYVDADAPGDQSGSSWAHAFPRLEQALAVAGPFQQVRVAEGSYRPDNGSGDRTASFAVGFGVDLRGGYAGFGAVDPDLRAPETFVTILDGDLLGDDVGSVVNRDDNSLQVVTLTSGGLMPTRLDGLTIRGGNADGTTGRSRGGGLWTNFADVIIEQCVFTENMARDQGAGMFVQHADVTLVDCRFLQNRVVGAGAQDIRGGGMNQESGTLDMRRCRFVGNRVTGTAQHAAGGGLSVTSGSARIESTRFLQNVIDFQGSGFVSEARGGGLSCAADLDLLASVFIDNFVTLTLTGSGFGLPLGGGAALDGPSRVTTSRFHGNTAGSGAGLTLRGPGSRVADSVFTGNTGGLGGALNTATGDVLSIAGCTFTGNSASSGAGVYVSVGSVALRNSILFGNTSPGTPAAEAQLDADPGDADVAWCCVEGGVQAGPGNITDDPLFVDVLGADGVLGTEDDDVGLSAGSPCIDAGDVASLVDDAADSDCDGAIREDAPLDVAGLERRVDDLLTADTGAGAAPLVDMGAREFGAGLPTQQWSVSGSGVAGTHGTPSLAGGGTLCEASLFALELQGALPNRTLFLVLGLSAIQAPFKGGTLVPNPDLVLGGLPTGPFGSVAFELPFGVSDASGLTLVWQAWIPDPAGPVGFASTNGVVGVVP